TMLCAGAILMYASYLIFVQNPPLPHTSFFMVMACLVGIGESLRRLSKLSAVLARSNAAAARVFEILDVPVERTRREAPGTEATERRSDEATKGEEAEGAALDSSSLRRSVAPSLSSRIVLPPIQREIRFENICFSYANSPNPAVEEVNLVVPRGRSVAIVGRN